jgi:hypothetical protein
MTTQRTTTKAALRMASSFLPELLEEHLDPAVAASVAKSLIRKAPFIQYLPQKDEIVLHLSLDSAGEVEPGEVEAEIPGQTAIDDPPSINVTPTSGLRSTNDGGEMGHGGEDLSAGELR